ncbi:MAG: hypothetical protein Q4E12_07835 [Coriobacteriia bacterium]|nr:hypothetical protein [Coriobacteriia bacterium]
MSQPARATNNQHAISESLNLSRRTVLAGAVGLGVLHILGIHRTRDGATLAYADTTGAVSFKVYVLSKEEVPVVALNVANNANIPLEGMTITLTSLGNGTSQTLTTDEFGMAKANVRKLSEDSEDPTLEGYVACVRAEGSLQGYRRTILPINLLHSGIPAQDGVATSTLQMPTQPDDGLPYLSCVALDGVDVQYTPATVGLDAANDLQHTLDVQIENAGSSTWIAELHADGITMEADMAQAVSGTARIRLSGPWFDGNHAIIEGSTAQVLFQSYQQSFGSAATLNLPLTFVNSVRGLESIDADRHLSPDNPVCVDESETKKSFNPMPFVLVREGDECCLGVPFVPIKVFSDILGNIGIAATLVSCDIYKNKDWQGDSTTDEDRWKSFLALSAGWKETFKKNFKEHIQQYNQAAMDMSDANNPQNRKLGASKVTTCLSATFSLDLMGLANPRMREGSDVWHWAMDLAAQLKLSVDFAASQTVVVMGIPLYWAFDVSGTGTLKLMAGIQFDYGLSNVSWGHSISKEYAEGQGNVCVFHIEMGLGGGVGVYGMVSFGVRGYAYFRCVHMTSDTSDIILDKPYPRTVIKAAIGAQATIQVLLFKKTYTLAEAGPWKIYDTWNSQLTSGGPLLESGGVPATFNGRFGTPAPLDVGENAGGRLLEVSADELEMVTEDSLEGVTEFETSVDADGVLSDFGFCGRHTVHTVADPGISDPYVDAPPIATEEGDGGLLTGVVGGAGSGYNPLRGVQPNKQVRVWGNTFSDPKAKVIICNGKAYLLRLTTVKVRISASDPNLEVVADKDGCRFARAKAGNNLPVVSLSADGQQVVYPEAAGDVPVARLCGFAGQDGTLAAADEDAPGSAADLVAWATQADPASLADSASVTLAPEYVLRTRLCVSAYNESAGQWGTPWISDFALPVTATQYLRVNTWDVDFDAVAADGEIYVGLCSIARPLDSDKTYDEQFKLQFTTSYVLDAGSGRMYDVRCNVNQLNTGTVSWHPRMAVDTTESLHMVAMVRYQREKDASLDKLVADSWSCNPSTHIRTPQRMGYSMDTQDTTMKTYLGQGTFDLTALSSTNEESIGVMVAWSVPAKTTSPGAHSAHSCLLAADITQGEQMEGLSLPNVMRLSRGPLTFYDQTLHAFWMYTVEDDTNGARQLRRVNGTLVRGSSHVTSPGFKDAGTPLGISTTGLNFFTSADGRRLYATRSMEGTAPALDDDVAAFAAQDTTKMWGTYSPLNSPSAEMTGAAAAGFGTEEVRQYQLQCAHYDDGSGSYFDFFPLAELDFPPDTLIEVPTSRDQYDFVAGSITNISNNAMDLYHVVVPKVRGLQMEGAQPTTHMVLPGETCYVKVRVSNVGNAVVGGFTVHFTRADTGAEVGVQKLSDLASVLQPGLELMQPTFDAAGKATGEYQEQSDARDDAGALWPGKSRTYLASFVVPKDMTGEVEFLATVSDPVKSERFGTTGEVVSCQLLATGAAGEASLLANDVAEPLLTVDPRARRVTLYTDADVAADTTVREATYHWDDYKYADNTTTSAKSTGVNTSDNLPLSALVATAAAAAAVTVTAYHMAKQEDSKGQE